MNQAERKFGNELIEAAGLFGWQVVHFRPAKTRKGYRTAYQGDGGFPDLVLARNACVIFAELKTDAGRVRADQWDWLAAFAGCTVEEMKTDVRRSRIGGVMINATNLVVVWRPRHWPKIRKVLETWITTKQELAI